MKRKINVQINFPAGGGNVAFTVGDERANSRILRFELTPKQFVEALGSLYLTNVDAEVYPKNVGTRFEHKTEWVTPENREAFLVNGWHERYGDFGNPHVARSVNDVRGYDVVYFRNIPDDVEDDEDE